MKRKKQRRRLSLEWSLLASAGIFFIFGKYIASQYEQKLYEARFIDEIVPVSRYSVIASGVLFILFVLAMIFRFVRKKS
jgi:uncharacterized BrkB/YihY/UPF0761 family membrane protein